MGTYIVRRLLGAIPLLIVISIVVFLMLHAAPGGPAAAFERRGVGLSPQDLQAFQDRLGLNDPIHIQYVKWVGRVLQGDFGDTVISRRPVTAELRDRIGPTFYLMGTAWLLTLLIAIPIGILSAVRQYSKFDHVVTGLTFVGQSVPIYFLGLVLILIFSLTIRNPATGAPLLPATGMRTIGMDFDLMDRLKHLILPVTMLTAGWIAWYSRFLRASMLEVIHQDYVRTARAKGLRERFVIGRHAFRNAAIPLVTLMALDLPFLFTGALFTEVIFAWPGMGRLFYEAAQRRDYNLLMAIIMITAVLIIFANLLADIFYALLDPRIRYQ